jgi:hypothetical protein
MSSQTANPHQACLAQNPQVLRNGRLALAERAGQIAHGQFALQKLIEQGTAGGVGYRPEDIGTGSDPAHGSHNLISDHLFVKLAAGQRSPSP